MTCVCVCVWTYIIHSNSTCSDWTCVCFNVCVGLLLMLNATHWSLLWGLSPLCQGPISSIPSPHRFASSTASFFASSSSHLQPWRRRSECECDRVFVPSGFHFKDRWFWMGQSLWNAVASFRWIDCSLCVCKPQQCNIRGSGDTEMTPCFPVQMSISRQPCLRLLFKGPTDQLCVMCCLI